MIRHAAPPRKTALAFAAALALVPCGCGSSAADQLQKARQGLADAAYADAIAAADAGLRADPDEKTSWGLELVKLEAQARSGQGEPAVGQLEKLARLHPDAVPATQYCATAYQLRAAGNGEVAIRVLDLGKQRHPGDPAIDRMIGEASRSTDVAPAELDLLRSLGYVE